MTDKSSLRKRWLTGCGTGLLVVLAMLGWYAHLLMRAFTMQNQVYQETRSPDGRYVATLAYSDGMTFGYYFVCIQPSAGRRPLQPDDPIPHEEVAEVGAEGLNSVSWVGSHKLVVDYDNFGAEKAQFVLQKKAWRDVRIVYRGS